MAEQQTNAGIEVERTDFVPLATRDKERALKFYGETLGLKRNELARPGLAGVRNRERHAGDHGSRAGRDGVRHVHNPIAFRVADVAEARGKLESAGVEFHGETLDTGVCHMAFFSDPDGNALMLHRRYAPYSDGSKP